MSTPSNPEFEYYRRLLLQRRRYYPMYGLLLFIVGWLGNMALIPLYLHNPQLLFAFHQSPHLLHFILLIVFFAALVVSFTLIASAFSRPSVQSVQRFRQRQRQRLFLQAHGRAPWWSNPLLRILIAIVGLMFVGGGGVILGIFGPIALDGWIYLLVGAFLLALPGYFIPREMKKFPALSAEQLAQDWIVGEATPESGELE